MQKIRDLLALKRFNVFVNFDNVMDFDDDFKSFLDD